MISVIVQHTTLTHPSAFQAVADGLIVAILSGLGIYVIHQFKAVRELREFIIGRPKSDFEPARVGFIDQMKANTKETKENSEAVLAMSTRFGQQNGTVLEIRDDIAKLHTEFDGVKTSMADIAGRPPASVAEVKEAVASEHIASEARQAEILEAIQSDTAKLVTDITPNDGSSSKDALTRIEEEQARVKDELHQRD